MFTCSECSGTFRAKRFDAITCGATCRKRAERRRSAARSARIRELLATHSDLVREGMSALDMSVVRDRLDKVAAELDTLTR